MNHYVIGEDKSLEEAYTADEVDGQLAPINAAITSINSAITALQTSAAKIKNISSGTAAPSGGANGDIYIQY